MACERGPGLWFPRAYLGFTRPQVMMLTCMPAARSHVARLRSRPDLWLLAAAQVATACAAVRPVALYWDLAPARGYFNRRFGMLAPPPFRVRCDSGRWQLPGEVDVDTQVLNAAEQLRHRMVA
jgi:hypothetical protein